MLPNYNNHWQEARNRNTNRQPNQYHVPYNGPVFHRPLPPTNRRPPTNPSSYIPPHRRPTYNTAYQSRGNHRPDQQQKRLPAPRRQPVPTHKEEEPFVKSLSPAQHINATAESPLCSPFGTKPKVASPGSNLYRIQGPSVRQITPTKLPNYDSDDFGNEYESDFDDSDNDPNWHPEKKRRLLVFSSDDGVEPLPDDDDDDISLPNKPTNADVQVTNPDSPNTPRLTDGKSKRSRRGKRILLQWDRNVNQILRMKGKSYRGVKRSEDGRYCQAAVKRERKLKERKCSKACALSKRCGEFSEEDRLSILNRFWGELTWKQKKVFVANMVDQVKMVERKKRAEDSRKKNSYRYHLKKNDARTVVCRNMFLSTLDLQDKTVYEWVKNDDDGIPKEPAIRNPEIDIQ
ncbi:hypothetical protein LOTGIDRAFT_176660, partial [Lottia gigantea]